jgi:hypothetical protein
MINIDMVSIYTDRYKILLEALGIIIVALGIGYWLKRKFGIGRR